MAVFGGMTLTNKGLVLQGKAQAGGKLNYTRIAVGDGSLTGQAVPAMNGLISQKISLPITRITTQPPNKAIIGSVLRNADVSTGFYWREVGVFAQDPDAGEILYAYANAGVTADYIPPGGGSDIIEKTFDCVVVVGTAANITAVIDESLVFAKKTELDALADAKVDKVSGKGLSANDYTTAEKNKLAGITAGAGGAGTATDAVIGNRTISDTTAPTGDSGTVTNLLGWLANTIKSITGKSSWRTAPATTLEAAKAHADDTTRHLTAAERTAWNAKETTAGAQAKADAVKAAAATDASTKANAVQANLTSHTGNTTVHITAEERTAWNAKADSSQLGRVDLTQTLGTGTSVIQADQNGSELDLVVHGRTLANLIFRNKAADFMANGGNSTVSRDTFSTKYSDVETIQVAYTGSTAGSGTGYQLLPNGQIDPTKYYVFAIDIQVVEAVSARALFEFGTGTLPNGTVAGNSVTLGGPGQWKTSFGKVGPLELAGKTKFYFHLQVFGEANLSFQSAIGTGFRFYEISKDEYDRIGTSLTADNFDDYYPFVAGRQHIQGVSVTKQGRNLYSGGGYSLGNGAGTALIEDLAKSSITVTSGTAAYSYMRSKSYTVVPNTVYTLSAVLTNVAGSDAPQISVRKGSDEGYSGITGAVLSGTGAKNISFNSGSETEIILFAYGSVATSTAQTKRYDNIQIELGSTTTPFTPAEPQSVVLPVTLGQIGDVRDSVYSAGVEWMYLERVKKRILSGSAPWMLAGNVSGDVKRVYLSGLEGALRYNSFIAMKYDGRILSSVSSMTDADQAYFTEASSRRDFYLSVANTDGGWGASYSPTAAEISAYFYGYRMNNGTFGTPYNGSGMKTWTVIGATSNAGAVTTVPAAQAPITTVWQPYTLDYMLAQAAQPVSLPNAEGSITLHPGGNQISVETGVIQRESVVPKLDSGRYYILAQTDSYWGAARLSKLSSKMLAVYRGADIDPKWRFTVPNEVATASLAPEDYDSKAAYYVTYLARDKFMLTANVTEVAASWRTGLGGVVSEVVQSVAELRQDNDRQDFADDYIEAKVDNLKLEIADASALPDTIQKFKLTEKTGYSRALLSSDFNNILQSGEYSLIGSVMQNGPVATPSGYLRVRAIDAGNVIQEVVLTPTFIGWSRRITGGTWNSWVENENSNKKNAAGGYAGLDATANISVDNLPFGSVTNILGDSGRFVGPENGAHDIYCSDTFVNNRFFTPMNGTSVSSGGKFYFDNSTFGGTRNALTDDITSLLNRIGSIAGGVGTRYGTEYHIASYTMGSGTGNPNGTIPSTNLMTANGTLPAGGLNKSFTTSFWIRVKSGTRVIINKSGRLKKNGVTQATHVQLTTADGWVHIERVEVAASGYSNGAPAIFATAGDVVQIALPVVTAGDIGVGIHNNPVMGASLGYVPLDSAKYTAADVLSKLITVDGSGSGLEADLLDGLHGINYMRTDTVAGDADLNTIVSTGVYRLMASAMKNHPGPNYYYGQMLVLHAPNSDTITQIVYPYTGFGPMYRRGNPTNVGGSGSWSNWFKMWTEENDGAGSGLDADLHAGKTLAEVVQGSLSYLGTIAGSSPNFTASANPPIVTLASGQRLSFKALSSTSGPITLNVNGLGAKSIKKPNGNNPPLVQGGVYTVVYDGTAFILQGEGGEYGTATASHVLSGYSIGTENGVVNGEISNNGPGGTITPNANVQTKPAGFYSSAISISGVAVPVDKVLNGTTIAGSLGTMPNRSAENNNMPPQETAYWPVGAYNNPYAKVHFRPPAGYYNGSTWISADSADMLPENVLAGKSIFGMKGNIPNRTNDQQAVTSWTNGAGALSLGFPTGAYLTSSGFGAGIASVAITNGNFTSGNIRSGVNIFGVVGNLKPISSASGIIWAGGSITISGLGFRPKVFSFSYNPNGESWTNIWGYFIDSSILASPYSREILSVYDSGGSISANVTILDNGITISNSYNQIATQNYLWSAWG